MITLVVDDLREAQVDGADGLEATLREAGRPDAVVLVLRLAGMRGRELYRVGSRHELDVRPKREGAPP